MTDVQGSTRSWEASPDAMDQSLRTHDEIMRAEIERRHGYTFSTAGDSFAVAFSSAGAAISTAIEMQRRLLQTRWPSGVSIEVRMGLHTGHAVERNGQYFGAAVNRAARVMAAAHGGEIVCTAVTAELAQVDLPGDARLHELGAFRLRDLLEPIMIFQVEALGIRTEFPPLRSLDAVHHNLPVQRTRLIGRDDEVAALTPLVRTHRLVTLTGAGGSGKSRLALGVAAELLGEFDDGVYLVELAPVSQADRVADTVAAAVGFHPVTSSGAPDLLSALASGLAHRDTLMVLDNCEHLLDAVAELVEVLLSSGDRVRIVATSREALEVDGEHVHQVPPLPTGSGADSAAVELFAERRAERHDSGTMTRDERRVAAEICQRLDGLPLAIELAVAQLQALTPSELLARLDDPFRLLAGGRHRRHPRQQTLQAVMDSSWQLLSADERRLLGALSVLSGGWTLEAAEGIVGPHLNVPITAGLRALAAKSLVQATTTAEGRSRYRMLQTVRHYASQRLDETGTRAEWRDRHLAFYVEWVAAAPFAEHAFSLAWANRFWTEFTNVSAAIDWAVTTERFADAATLVSAGTGTYFSGIATRQALAWAEGLRPLVSGSLRARVLAAGALAAVPAGRHDRLRTWLSEAEDAAGGSDADVLVVTSVGQAAPLMVPEPDRAASMLQRGREAALQSGSSLSLGVCGAWQVVADLSRGRLDRPIALGDMDRFGGPDSRGWAIAAQAGAVAAALDGDSHHAEVLVSALSPLDPAAHLAMAGTRIMVEAVAGDPRRAHELARTFIVEVDRWSDVAWHGELVVLAGIGHLRAGDAAVALSYFRAARRATMAFPFWYRLLHHFTAEATAVVGVDAARESAASSLTVEMILDKELRTPT